MEIDDYEKMFLGLSAVVLLVLLGAIFWSVATTGIVLPGPVARVNPATLTTTPPFDNPGLRETAPGQYEAVLRAKIWQFEPNKLDVPVGATVKFYIASEDVIHGFRIMGVPVNVMVIPGEVSVVEHTFKTPGTYTYVCHEYCGAGHQAMFGTITVTGPAAAAPAPAMLAATMGGAH